MTLEVGDLVELNKQRALSRWYMPELPYKGIGVVVDFKDSHVYVFWVDRGRITKVPRILLIKILDKED